MSVPLRVLIVEDSKEDTVLMLCELRQAGYEPIFERVDTAEALTASLEREPWDIVISDYVLPTLDGMEKKPILPMMCTKMRRKIC